MNTIKTKSGKAAILKAVGLAAACYILVGLVFRPAWWWPTLPEHAIGSAEHRLTSYQIQQLRCGEWGEAGSREYEECMSRAWDGR